MKRVFSFGKGKLGLVLASAMALGTQANAALAIPESSIKELTDGATSIGGSAVTVWAAVAVAAIGIVIVKRVFR